MPFGLYSQKGHSKMKKTAKKISSAKSKSTAKTKSVKSKELNDWRSETLSKVRTLIKQADSQAIEELKWRGVPTWSHDGIICTGETYKDKVKLTFAKGAKLPDPAKLFNSSLEGNTRRAIDLFEGDKVNVTALKALVRAAVTLNTSSKK